MMDPVDLERLLDGELKQLPRPHAPRTLLARVMTATAQPAGAAAPSGWSTWPRAWQAAGGAAVLAFAAGLVWLAVAPPPPVAQTAQAAGKTIAIARALWDVLVQPAVAYVFVLGLLLALACAAAWTALEFALGEAPQQ